MNAFKTTTPPTKKNGGGTHQWEEIIKLAQLRIKIFLKKSVKESISPNNITVYINRRIYICTCIYTHTRVHIYISIFKPVRSDTSAEIRPAAPGCLFQPQKSQIKDGNSSPPSREVNCAKMCRFKSESLSQNTCIVFKNIPRAAAKFQPGQFKTTSTGQSATEAPKVCV